MMRCTAPLEGSISTMPPFNRRGELGNVLIMRSLSHRSFLLPRWLLLRRWILHRRGGWVRGFGLLINGVHNSGRSLGHALQENVSHRRVDILIFEIMENLRVGQGPIGKCGIAFGFFL